MLTNLTLINDKKYTEENSLKILPKDLMLRNLQKQQAPSPLYSQQSLPKSTASTASKNWQRIAQRASAKSLFLY